MKQPNNLGEAVFTIGRLVVEFSDFEESMLKTESMFLKDTHQGLGTWIRNTWGLWAADSRLWRDLKERGLDHPDDMSNMILICFYRDYHGRRHLDIESYADGCKLSRKQQEA